MLVGAGATRSTVEQQLPPRQACRASRRGARALLRVANDGRCVIATRELHALPGHACSCRLGAGFERRARLLVHPPQPAHELPVPDLRECVVHLARVRVRVRIGRGLE